MRRLLLFLSLLFLSCPLHAQSMAPCSQGQTSPLVAFASETITVSSTAVGFTSATINPSAGGAAIAAFVTIATDNIRVFMDGTVPTATVGHLFASSGTFTVCAADVARLRMIRQTTDATVTATYYRAVAVQ